MKEQMLMLQTKKGLCCGVRIKDIVWLKKGDRVVDVMLTDRKTIKEMKGEKNGRLK